MSALDEFKRKKRFAVCVDSDGCAMDTMNIKHIRCFGPCMVSQWGLELWREAILDRWNEINLYSATRGINRFNALAMALEEIDARYAKIDGVGVLAAWAAGAPELSNDALAKKAHEHPVFAKALAWSCEVNAAIDALPRLEVRPFEHVALALAAAHEQADVVVVSSANPEAVRREWTRFQLLEHVDLLCTQELGSKAYCIGELVGKGYDAILMCGDAPGDEQAARKNGVLFYPILVGRESESWARFIGEALGQFVRGTYAGAYQQAMLREFDANLSR